MKQLQINKEDFSKPVRCITFFLFKNEASVPYVDCLKFGAKKTS